MKQSIIAKAFNLPFDRRSLMQDTSTARPPSPITFAPIEDPSRGSEFSIRLRSYDRADQTQTDHRLQGQGSEGGIVANDFEVAGYLSDPNTTAQPDTEGAVPIVQPLFAEDKEQIYTQVFTLIRFSTGQILEDHLFVSWYNLGPHELVELHCSSPPTTFARALLFGHMLINGGSMTVDIPTSHQPGSHTSLNSTTDRHTSNFPAAPIVPFKFTTATLSLTLAESPSLTSLPRHDLASYTEPYWEGWVRVLCVMWRPDDCSPTGRLAETTSGGPTLSSGEKISEPDRRWKVDNDRWTKTNEWEERWAVIRNGVLRLRKNRDVSYFILVLRLF
jgi:hypothetical protein